LTGLPGAGKTRLAYAVERLLHERGHVGLAIDPEDAVSVKNVAVAQRPREAPAAVLELVERGVQVGWITLLAFASPDRESRERVRERVGAERYLEIFVNTPLPTCRERSSSNFYSESREPAYDVPVGADLVVDLSLAAPDQAARDVVELLVQRKFFQIA
jgi:adenylylsulfate kinase